MTGPVTLLAIGLTTLDVALAPVDGWPAGDATLRLDGVAISVAGTAGGAALAGARLGLATGLAGAIGADAQGRILLQGLAEAGVDQTLVVALNDRPTSVTVLPVRSDGQRTVLHALGAGHFLRPDERMLTAARQARFLHWGGVGLPRLEGGPGAELLAAAHSAGAVVTCDLIAPGPTALAELARLLPHVDYFMPSAAEAFSLAQTCDLGTAADLFLGLGAGAVIIKNGADGVYVALGAQRSVLPAHAITPTDTTSCGDSFCAGFIAGLDREWPPLQAARFGVAVSALVAQALGTLGKLETFDMAEAFMRQAPLRSAPPGGG